MLGGTVQTLSPQRSKRQQVLASLSPELREVFPRAAVYSHLISELWLSENTAQAIEKNWRLSAAEIERLNIQSCPTHTGNILASTSCLKNFGSGLLAETPGFYSFDYSSGPCCCYEWRDDCICKKDTWLLDLDPRLAAHGFILPIRHPKYLFFEALRVFRHSRDPHGFLLKLRREKQAA